MSRYDNREKDDLAEAIDEFLETHPVYQLLEIVSDSVRHNEEE